MGRPKAMGARPKAAIASRSSAAKALPGEAALHRLWRDRRIPAVRMADGDTVTVVFPGWPNTGSGPDFTGAVLRRADGRELRGDVEMHVQAGDWRRHGHDGDAAYQAVALHVAWSGSPAGSVAEGPAPLALLTGGILGSDPRPCVRHAPLMEEAALGAALDAEGDLRLETKASALAQSIAAVGPEQSLYAAILAALGYSSNQRPFADLAQRLPWDSVRRHALAAPPHEAGVTLEALLLGAAGLLPSQRGLSSTEGADDYTSGLDHAWTRHGAGSSPIATPWRSFRVRPENLPARRVAAAAALVVRHAATGLIPAMRDAVLHENPRRAPHALRDALVVPASTYWASHWDLGTVASNAPALLGEVRADDIIINAALPFNLAWATLQKDTPLAQRARELYGSWRPLAANHLLARMERMLMPERASWIVTTARRQQGLLGLYRRRCHALLCSGCALGGTSS